MALMKKGHWLFSLAATLGFASVSLAQENRLASNVDAMFNAPEKPFTDQIAPPLDLDLGCSDLGCDGLGAGSADEGFDLGRWVFGEDSSWDIGGWTQVGYHNRSTGMFNNQPNRFNWHQNWLYLEKVADGSKGLDIGGRMDFMYGIDSGDTQSFGNNPGNWDYQNGWDRGADYGFAMPQLYAEVAYGDVSVKIGHFYTLLGYEVVTAPDNFFYSHAMTMYNAEAFTHTGAVATYQASDRVTLYGGWTAGWDSGFDQFGGASSFLGGASVGITDTFTLTYILTAGDFGANGDGYSHSIVGDWKVTDKWTYVAQSDVDEANNGLSTVGLNQYLFYTINDKLAVGGRGEWWKANGDSYYQVTSGLNVRPMNNVVVRPEVRYQWSPAHNAANTGLVPVDEGVIFGIDAIFTF